MLERRERAFACTLVVFVSATGPVSAATHEYTHTGGSSCRVLRSDAEFNLKECKGPSGVIATVADTGGTANITFGRTDRWQPETPVAGAGVGDLIEWRSAGGPPYAAIVRIFTPGGPVLVVTRLTNDDACRVGYVDGAHSRANELAAEIADAAQGGFVCGHDEPLTIGRRLYGRTL